MRYLELPDNGYQLLIAWLAGPERVSRTTNDLNHIVQTTIRGSGGHPIRVVAGPAIGDDLQTVDMFVNGYLQDAGVPPGQGGFRWFLQLPSPLQSYDVWRATSMGLKHGEGSSSSGQACDTTRAGDAL